VTDDPYRRLAPIPPDPWLAAWRDLQQRRRLAYLAGAPFLLLLVVALVLRSHWEALWALLALLATMAANLRAISFRCPRCSERFTMRGKRRRSFNTSCDHCGLEMWTPRP
jgi:predicted RNA-binding Zn-ribbon protein involved in translation (DUF1610 family)